MVNFMLIIQLATANTSQLYPFGWENSQVQQVRKAVPGAAGMMMDGSFTWPGEKGLYIYDLYTKQLQRNVALGMFRDV